MSKRNAILILLEAVNLRLSVTAITPLFAAIQTGLNVSSVVTSLLVTLPLLCFAIGALLTPMLIARFGLKRLLIIANSLLIIGNLVRPLNSFWLIVGTLIIGLAIASLNVQVPAMIAQQPRDKATSLTSGYNVTMSFAAAMATLAVIPLAQRLQWQTVLGSFSIPALFALTLTLMTPFQTQVAPATTRRFIRFDATTRKLTLFMGLQSLIFYSLVTWLPTIFEFLGASSAETGLLFAVFQFVGIPAGLVLNRLTNRRLLMFLLLGGYTGGIVGLMIGQIGWWLTAIVLGFTCSLIFSTALTFIATSSANASIVTARSGVAQSLGYLLAAIGPVVFGGISTFTHSWSLVIAMIALLMIITIWAGMRLTTSN